MKNCDKQCPTLFNKVSANSITNDLIITSVYLTQQHTFETVTINSLCHFSMLIFPHTSLPYGVQKLTRTKNTPPFSFPASNFQNYLTILTMGICGRPRALTINLRSQWHNRYLRLFWCLIDIRCDLQRCRAVLWWGWKPAYWRISICIPFLRHTASWWQRWPPFSVGIGYFVENILLAVRTHDTVCVRHNTASNSCRFGVAIGV